MARTPDPKTGKTGKTGPLGTKQLPLAVKSPQKGDMRTQFAALCWRIRDEKPQVLLITTRGSKNWIIPKGWPEHRMTPGNAALREAWEEAGVIGQASELCLGLFSYQKRMADKRFVPCVALVYPVKVTRLARDFPESGQRKRRWYSPKKAASLVDPPELKQILKTFDAKRLAL